MPICVMSWARNAAGYAALYAATLGLLHDFGGRLWMELRLLTATPDCDSCLEPSAACLAAIRFGWQIATLTGGAPRKFLSAWCSIKDARFGNRKR